MLKTLELLNKSKIIQSFRVLDFKQGSGFYYLKCNATLRDGTELYIREYISSLEIIYAYHWQDANGNLITRWDNAPHHPEIKTHPHHKHEPQTKESKATDLEEVLEEITKKISA